LVYGVGTMKRAIVFGFLGPVLSGWVLLISNYLLDSRDVNYLLVAPYMVLQIIPLLMCGFADFLLDGVRLGERVVVLAVAGALLSCGAMLLVESTVLQKAVFVIAIALSGALAAAVCSLTTRVVNQGKAG